MYETLSTDDVSDALNRVAARLLEVRDWLTQLDAAIGDGDMGINLAKGAAGLQRYLASSTPGDDIGGLLTGAGMAFNREASSTIGTLIATGLMRAGKEAKGHSQLDAPLLGRMLVAASEGIQERGKAQPGDKTIVDALQPAAVTFADAIRSGQCLKVAAQMMLQASRQGRDAAIPLQSRVGRASWVGERTKNLPDPGTVVMVQMLETVLREGYSEPGSTQTTD